MSSSLDLVFFGLSLSSSWGNGHATTYRALLKGLAHENHRALFLECDQPWYAGRRDLEEPPYCGLALYESLSDIAAWRERIEAAHAVIVGSYVPQGAALLDLLLSWAPRRLLFYDIDTPVTLAALSEGTCTYLEERQLPELDLYLSFAGGAALERLQSRGATRSEELYCSVDADLYRFLDLPAKWDLGYLGTFSPDRQPALEALLLEPARRLPDFRFVVAGAQYPDDTNWPANVEYIEHIPPAQHAEFYNRQRFTLNLTRRAMRELGHSPSVRLFEAGACGTAILSDRWPGLGEVLPEDEAVKIVDSPEDVVAALSLPEAQRRVLARGAYQSVRGRHTGDVRARELASVIRSLSAKRKVSA